MRLAIFTVCSNDRVPQARVLLDTVARFLPGAVRYLVLADEPHPSVPYPPACHLVPARALGIPDFPGFAFRYDPAEFAAALKPFAFQHLFATRSCTHCLYFDPDIELFSSLPAVTAALADDAPFVLTPHLLAPAEDEDGPGDVAFLRDGAFNLGFLGVSATPQARELLAWWARWLRRDCVNDRPIGLYMDQRFVDLIPGFASGTRILHDPGLNVAPWNLAPCNLAPGNLAPGNLGQRAFVPDAPGGPEVDGEPLGFFHYAGFDPAHPGRLDDRTDRWHGTALPPAWRAFLAGYAARLLAAGHGTVPPGSYAYGRFASGVPIPGIARRMFRNDHEAWAGDPFDTYEAWCHLPARDAVVGLGSAIPSLMLQWLQARHPALADLSMREPAGSEGLVRWWLEHGTSVDVDRRFLQPMASAAGLQPVSPGAIRPPPHPDRADVAVIAPLSDAGPAGQAGRALAADLSREAGRVERLDVLAARSTPVSARVLAFCLPPDQLRPFLHVLRPRLPSRAYRVFVPAGERLDLSPALLQALAGVDEIWAPTRFLQARLATATRLPVLHMPLAWRWPHPSAREPAVPPGRPYILAERDDFPGCDEILGSVRAFDAAFRGVPAAYRPRLVIPSPRADVWNGTLREAIADADAIVLPDAASASDRMALVSGAACVLALHRGEALGLSVARAMACGVPVVATDDGGCTDLLTPRTGFPVDAHPAPPAEAAPATARVAADPCHAAWSLREVFDRPDEARRRAAAARQVLAAAADPAVAAAAAATRLRVLGLLPADDRMDAAA